MAEIPAPPVDEQMVRVQGNLLRKSKSETYVFSDGTGAIAMNIDDDNFPKQTVDKTSKVEVIGKVDTGLRRPIEIEAGSVRILP